MSNYPNMSYCMCENTLGAMMQIIDAMQEEGAELLNSMSSSERRAFEEIYFACQSFMKMSEELDDELDAAEEDLDDEDLEEDEVVA